MNKRKIQWTRQQEQHFQALAATRAEALQEIEKPLNELAVRLSQISQPNLAHFLRTRADEIRDVLEPFDSGVRLQVEDRASL